LVDTILLSEFVGGWVNVAITRNTILEVGSLEIQCMALNQALKLIPPIVQVRISEGENVESPEEGLPLPQ
jgi:hypothetical protein